MIGDAVRSNSLKYGNPAGPVIVEGAGTQLDYLFQGYPITVTSCVGNTITTSTPHLVSNVIPDLTKLWVTGSGSAACDGNYYVIAAPTATTLTVALATPTATGTGTGGSIQFQDGLHHSVSPASPPYSSNSPGR